MRSLTWWDNQPSPKTPIKLTWWFYAENIVAWCLYSTSFPAQFPARLGEEEDEGFQFYFETVEDAPTIEIPAVTDA